MRHHPAPFHLRSSRSSPIDENVLYAAARHSASSMPGTSASGGSASAMLFHSKFRLRSRTSLPTFLVLITSITHGIAITALCLNPSYVGRAESPMIDDPPSRCDSYSPRQPLHSRCGKSFCPSPNSPMAGLACEHPSPRDTCKSFCKQVCNSFRNSRSPYGRAAGCARQAHVPARAATPCSHPPLRSGSRLTCHIPQSGIGDE